MCTELETSSLYEKSTKNVRLRKTQKYQNRTKEQTTWIKRNTYKTSLRLIRSLGVVFGVAAARVFDLFLASLGHPMRSYFEFLGKLKICFFFGTGGMGSRFQNRSVGTETKPNQTELELAVQCNVFSRIDCTPLCRIQHELQRQRSNAASRACSVEFSTR